MSGVAWFDDRPLDAADARVPIDDASVMLGDGVCESIAIGPRGPFAVTRHIRRLRSAAERIGIDAPSEAQLRRAIATVAEAASQPAMLRVTVAARGVEPGSGARLIVTTRPLRAHGEAASAAIGPWVRNEVGFLAGLKSTSWGENAAALRAARRYGADEALFVTTRGDVCEGASCNVFAVIDGHLATPPLSAGCLPGITRELLLEHGVAGERPIAVDELWAATEVFLTSSGRGVHPVRRLIDGHHPERSVALPAPGAVGRAVAGVWSGLIESSNDP